MNNYETALDATSTAHNSQGSAMRENAKYMESMEAKTNQLKNAFTALSLSIGDSFLKDAILLTLNGLTSLANAGAKVADTIGTLPAVFAPLAMVLAKMGLFSKVGTMIGNTFGDIKKRAENLSGSKGILALADGADKTQKRFVAMQLGIGRSLEKVNKSFQKVRQAPAQFLAEMQTTDRKAGLFANSVQVLGTASRVASGAMPRLAMGVKMLGIAVATTMRSVLSATAIGAVFMAVGFAIEKLISAYQKKKEAEEEAQKTMDTMINSYRNSGSEIQELANRYDELYKKQSGIKEGTELHEEFVNVQNKLADALPTVVDYIDAEGNAHLQNNEVVQEAIKLAEELSVAKAKEEKESFETNVDAELKKVNELISEYGKLADEKKRLEDTANRTIQGYEMGDNAKGIAKVSTEMLMKRQELQASVQDITTLIQNQTSAFLESDQKLASLTDSQRAIFENMAINAKDVMNKIILESDPEDVSKKLNEKIVETYETATKVGEAFANSQEEMSKRISASVAKEAESLKLTSSEASKLETERISEMKAHSEQIAKLIPKNFMTVENEDSLIKMAGDMENLIRIRDQLLNQTADSTGLINYFVNLGMEVGDAEQLVGKLALTYGNTQVATEVLGDETAELAQEMSDLKNSTLEAMDALMEITGVSSGNKEALSSYFEAIKKVKDTYGEIYKDTDAYRIAIERLGEAFGVAPEVIEAKMGTYETYVGMMEKIEEKADGGLKLSSEATKAEINLFNNLLKIMQDTGMTMDDSFGQYLIKSGLVQESTNETTEAVKTLNEESGKVGQNTGNGVEKIAQYTGEIKDNVNSTPWDKLKGIENFGKGGQTSPQTLISSAEISKIENTKKVAQATTETIQKIPAEIAKIDNSQITNIAVPVGDIGVKARGSLSDVQKLGSAIKNIGSAGTLFAGISNAMATLSGSFTRVSNAIGIMKQQIATSGQSFGTMHRDASASFANINGVITNFKSSIDKLKAKFSEVAKSFRSSMNGMVVTAVGRTAVMVLSHRTHSSSLDKVKTSANKAREAVNTLGNTISTTMGKLDKYIEKANKAREAGQNAMKAQISSPSLPPSRNVGQTGVSADSGDSGISAMSMSADSPSVASSSFGGDSGSSGVIRPSFNSMGELGVSALATTNTPKELPELYKVDAYERQMTLYEGRIDLLNAKMSALTENTKEYREMLQRVINAERVRIPLLTKELARLEARQKVVQRSLKTLGNTSKHTQKQREDYNRLQQELDDNTSKINSIRVEIENVQNDIKEKSVEIFTDAIAEISNFYDKAIDKMNKKVENIDFRMSVFELTDPDNTELQGMLLSERNAELRAIRAERASKVAELEQLKHIAVKRYGSTSKQAQDALEKLTTAQEEYRDAVLDVLQNEKDIRDMRADFADDVIDKLKDNYKKMSDMESDAYDEQIKNLEELHKKKMKAYDEELKKIDEIYDARIKEIDDKEDEETYAEDVARMTKEAQELQDKIARLSRNDSTASNRKQLSDLNKELMEKQEELAKYMKDKNIERTKEELEEQRDKHKELIEKQKEADEEIHENAIIELEKEKEAREKFYQDIIDDEKRWTKVREDLIKGNFATLEGELAGMQTSLEGLNQELFASMLKDFNDYVSSVKKGINDIKNTTGGVKTDTTYEDATRNPVDVAKKGVLTTGTFTDKQSAETLRRYIVTGLGATGANLLSEGNAWRIRANFVTVDKAQRALEELKRQKKLYTGYISSFDTGGYTGDWNSKNGKLGILHEKELILDKADTSNILDVVKMTRDIVPTIKQNNFQALAGVTGSGTTIVNEYNFDMKVDSFAGTRKEQQSVFKEMKKAFKKAGRQTKEV